ncbi:MAG: 1-acyl-sn-glycerol-3-phosphate acyltransferase [Candidatus Omnitrophica bacterium]|nr:1-acyl-sn-glycerol-3-phosphate acyltransferase [Candidatus Omnitrophota bacterium]
MRILLSIVFWIITALTTLIAFLIVFFLGVFFSPFFDSKRKLAHAQGFWWSDVIIGVNPFWKFYIQGLEHIDPKKTYVIVANHQSLADIVLLYKTHMQFKWVAKGSLFKIPVFGWCMSWMRHIKLVRGQYGSIRDVYRQAAYWLREGISVFFFPEGTRSHSAQMNDFKNGAFKLAIKEKKPILPIRIEGSWDIIPRGSWIFKTRAFCRVTVLPAIDTSAYQPKDFILLRDKVWEILATIPNKQ